MNLTSDPELSSALDTVAENWSNYVPHKEKQALRLDNTVRMMIRIVQFLFDV